MVAAVVLIAVIAGSCGSSVGAQRVAASHGGSTAEVASAPGPAAEQAAASAATASFRIGLGNESAAFVSDVGHLQAELQAGDLAAAQADELGAQAEFDQFREVAAGSNPINASTIDELAADVGPGQTFGGLHAVEKDLWDPPTSPAVTGGSADDSGSTDTARPWPSAMPAGWWPRLPSPSISSPRTPRPGGHRHRRGGRPELGRDHRHPRA